MTLSLDIITRSPEETRNLGELIGRAISEKFTIALTGDLGAGKTVFVQGLARGLSVSPDDPVTSPTYTLINDYPGRVPLFHADLYRLSGAAELESIGFDDVADANAVLVVEWADRLAPGELAEDLDIRIVAMDDTQRKISLFFCGRKKTDLINQLQTTFHIL
jgi:tRNA threonylcarbamoyladenosine biosynthesis protein TsaE